MSDFHPESWNPMWSVSTILTGLYSFMLENQPTLGSLEASHAQRQKLAAQSLAFNCNDATFRDLFTDLVDLHDERLRQARVPAAADVAAATKETGLPDGGGAGAEPHAPHAAGEPRPLFFVACVGATLAVAALVCISQLPS
mmetsp:Transcript_6680/g.17471  ORF Transcript_6680/g.17471 Transcript_6680/m.17471 type:complete len:141 (+) Transcript_6680:1-423(+)